MIEEYVLKNICVRVCICICILGYYQPPEKAKATYLQQLHMRTSIPTTSLGKFYIFVNLITLDQPKSCQMPQVGANQSLFRTFNLVWSDPEMEETLGGDS